MAEAARILDLGTPRSDDPGGSGTWSHHREKVVFGQEMFLHIGWRQRAAEWAHHEVDVSVAQLLQQRFIGAIGDDGRRARVRQEQPRKSLRHQHGAGHRQGTNCHPACGTTLEGSQLLVGDAQLCQRQLGVAWRGAA